MKLLRALIVTLVLSVPVAACTSVLPTALPDAAEADAALSGTGFLGGGTR